jgi:hypothetical protein
MFGITPDPRSATLGVLLTTDIRARWALLGIPMAWCVVGGIFLWAMEEPGYVVMAVAGILSAIAAVAQRRRGPLTSAVRPA